MLVAASVSSAIRMSCFCTIKVPLNHLLKKIRFSARTTLKHAATKLLCNTVLNFNVGFNVADISTKHWLYFPEKKYLFYRLGFWNNICAQSTPQGHSAIYGELSLLPDSKTKQQQIALQEKALQQAVTFLKLTPHNIVTQKNLVLPHAYVIYDAFREKNLAKILQLLREQNITSTGRFGEWKYSSMQEAVLDGQQTAQACANSIKQITPGRTTPLPLQPPIKRSLFGERSNE